MNLVFTSYSSSPEFDDPRQWLKRIEGYTGILERLGREQQVFGIERIDYEGKVDQNGVQYYFTRLSRKVVHFPWRLHRLVKQLRPDIVFINGFIFPIQIMQLRMKLGRRVKIIVFHRAERPFQGLKRYLQRIADRCVDAYLFTSISFGEEWKEHIDTRRKIHEVIQGSSTFSPMDRSAARAITGVDAGAAFLWVGRLNAGKDPLVAVSAFLRFAAKQPNARFYMIYQTDELLEEIRRMIIADRQLTGSVVLVGMVPHDQLQYWYSSCDYFITCSHYEGSGIALSEAMSCGCIPVVSDFISFRTMTGPGKCGVVFKTGDVDDLTKSLISIVAQDRRHEKEKTIRQFREELSFDAIAGKINRLVETLKGERKSKKRSSVYAGN